MFEQTLRCACGAIYKFYNWMVGDQSMCPKCRAEAARNMGSYWLFG